MPVFFENGDILRFNVDAIVIPHAPKDRMPWCDYGDKDFWDITLDVFSRADMEKMVDKYYLCRGNGYKIGEDFVDDEDSKKGYFSSDKYPEVTVTKFCGLPVNCVFHVCVRPYTEYVCEFDDYNLCVEREKYMLSRCYWMALNCAARQGIKKIAFPLFSTDCPKEIAYAVAHSVPQKWIDENTEYKIFNDPSHGTAYNKLMTIISRPDAEMQIYIVEPGRQDMLRMEALRNDPSEHRPFISEFGWRLKREMSAFEGGADEFKVNFIQKCFKNYHEIHGCYSSLVKITSYTPLYKFKDDPLICPHKHRVIAIAVAMGLSDYERFAFIHCAGYENYPEDERDFLVEELIFEGKRDFKELNEALIDKDPSYALDKDVKGA